MHRPSSLPRLFPDLSESIILESLYWESRRNFDWIPDETFMGDNFGIWSAQQQADGAVNSLPCLLVGWRTGLGKTE